MMDKLTQLEAYPYYFLFTITSYGNRLEKNLPPKEQLIDTFSKLSQRLGKERVIWRYDPVLIMDQPLQGPGGSYVVNEEYHLSLFETYARRLASFTDRCIISFLAMYKKCQKNLKGFPIREPGQEEMFGLAKGLGRIAAKYDIKMVTCAEDIELSALGIEHGKCIDDSLISTICGYPLTVKKDKNQRNTCRCVESIDIGAYNSCNHICLYCYANADEKSVNRNSARHNPLSPLLVGELSGEEKIVERKSHSSKKIQRPLF